MDNFHHTQIPTRSHKLVVFYCLLIFYSCNSHQQKEDHYGWTNMKIPTEQEPYFTKIAKSDLHKRKTFAGLNPLITQRYLAELDSVKASAPSLSNLELQQKSDSIANALEIRLQGQLQLFDDSLFIATDFLQQNFELSIEALNSATWRDSISLDVFEEFILPYKLAYEVADTWRDTLFRFHCDLTDGNPELRNLDSLYAYHMDNTYYGLKSGGELNRNYPSEPNFSWLAFSKEGDCGNRCRYMMYHLRAAGAPATYDYIPGWGNRPVARHAYVGLAHRDQQLSTLLQNDNNPNNLVNDLNAAMFTGYQYVFNDEDLPLGLYVQYEKTIPKIYRETWTDQDEIVEIYKTVPHDQIDRTLIRPNMVDVTTQYLKTTDIEVGKPLFCVGKMAYLATFDLKGWTPVAYSKFNFLGRAQFKDMGKNILYMPMLKNQQNLEPVGDPFIVENSGDKRIVKPNYNDVVDLHLIRKFPFFSYAAAHARDFKGCIIEGANKPDFSDASAIHTVDYYPFFMHRATIETEDSFRYIRFRSPSNKPFRMAQMECYSGEPDNLQKIEQCIIYPRNSYWKRCKSF